MINLEKFTLDNGLRVIVSQNPNSPLAVVNLLYDVGSKDENPEKTGFAHLFEHFMFSGSANVPALDNVLEKAGGSNNAFTEQDYTNYYEVLPKNNIETAFWIESDRMKNLIFSEKALITQKGVVIEEFKENYLNSIYGDIPMLIYDLAYKKHPYRWLPIGKEIAHIEKITLDDVKDFYHKYYVPNNAILCVSGNFKTDYIKEISEKWFGDIESKAVPERSLPQEPPQTEARYLTVERDVPYNVITKAYHVEGHRNSSNFYSTKLLENILSEGESARLAQKLMREKRLFSDISAFQSPEIDRNLFLFSGYLNEDVSFREAENAIDEEIMKLIENPINQYDIEKLQNNIEFTLATSKEKTLDKAIEPAYFELWDKAERINEEAEFYKAVKPEDIRLQAEKIFRKENSSTLYYKAKK